MALWEVNLCRNHMSGALEQVQTYRQNTEMLESTEGISLVFRLFLVFSPTLD